MLNTDVKLHIYLANDLFIDRCIFIMRRFPFIKMWIDLLSIKSVKDVVYYDLFEHNPVYILH